MLQTTGLDDIQEAINACSRAILGCSKTLNVWEVDASEDGSKRSIYEVVSRDREIVRC